MGPVDPRAVSRSPLHVAPGLTDDRVMAREHVVVRRIRSSDAAELERFYADLGPETRRKRFFMMTAGLSHPQSVTFCTPDHDHGEGFVAAIVHADGSEDRIVGHLCLEPAAADTAEVAIAVADSWQGRGIGRRLLAAGVAWARAVGIQRFTATMFATNVPIQRLLRSLGLPSRFMPVEPEVASITIDIAPADPIAA